MTDTKPIEHHFAEWEHATFGRGYGTGEPHTLAALKAFMAAIGNDHYDHAYDHTRLEEALTPLVAWLLINTLCRANIIEYGTSPRFGWLTEEGKELRTFIASKSVDELFECCMIEDLDHCAPTFCNCGPEGYSKVKLCFNPFWKNAR